MFIFSTLETNETVRSYLPRRGLDGINRTQHFEQLSCVARTAVVDLSAACTRLGIVPASHILSRLSSDRLSLRHALLNPASAAALSEGLSFNRRIRSLNLGRYERP